MHAPTEEVTDGLTEGVIVGDVEEDGVVADTRGGRRRTSNITAREGERLCLILPTFVVLQIKYSRQAWGRGNCGSRRHLERVTGQAPLKAG